ncbi:uroporphyrinogen-III C-methyltransferase [Alkalihalobacterium chitinilyticum]|uniref:uroporphyrinogen-III C-methyltransferase n=1 Tax=Alkalihalobacterium chitinilyticum TaxID=2980103 RepID=A0ABT5VA07_9BACI|nr:uroporphyrinogen-III C-methyltransferase [Alkalihalobacterium chitinilyticum]MDE5412172.1 uroporphyrinogen-III C-methyltransferase [Alkalihalobacterium chitinilyticum]
MKKGIIYLVGAGPGDAGLLTIKAKKVIEQADVIVYDRLVNPTLLLLAKPNAELIYAGKLPKRHIMRQEKINETLVEHGLAGKVVVRLKGGDPSVFGRVGEEADSLAQADIAFEIIPGITSSIAAASYAGIPVTHREYGGTFAVVTGHDKSTSGEPLIDWSSLAKGIDTIAFYMGVSNIFHIATQLMKHGRPADTPVILIQWGTYGRQKTLVGTLETIGDKVEKTKFQNPAITLVGDIVALRKKIKWFETKPLIGKQILVARTSAEKSILEEKLSELGADVYNYPSFEETSFLLSSQNNEITKKINKYDKITFTSPDSIRYFFEWLHIQRIDIRSIQAKFQVLSDKSLQQLRKYGCMAEKVQDIVDLVNHLIVGEEKAVEVFTNTDKMVTHENQITNASQIVLQRLMDDQLLSTIIIPSAKSVLELQNGAEQISPQLFTELLKLEIICYGEKSAQAASKAGFKVNHILNEPSHSALVDYLLKQSQVESV